MENQTEKQTTTSCQENSKDTSTQSKTKKTKVHKQSEKYPFKSMYKEGYINAGNYIAELIFKKRSEAFNSGKNAEQFWLTGNRLHGAYKGEVIAANKLLKKYHVLSVAQAIQSNRAKYILKLSKKENIKKLTPIIEYYERQRKDTELLESEQEKIEVSKPFGNKKKNILKDL